jgi:hypothetical protein
MASSQSLLMPPGMGELELQERSHMREISTMKWNTPDWWLGLLAGVLFGHYIALCMVDGIIQPSSDAKKWIGVSGLIGNLIVVQVRSWRFRSKTPPASIH